MLDIHRLFYMIDNEPTKAKAIAMVVGETDDLRVESIANMDIDNPWESIGEYMKNIQKEERISLIVSMMEANLRETDREMRKRNDTAQVRGKTHDS